MLAATTVGLLLIPALYAAVQNAAEWTTRRFGTSRTNMQRKA
jgi:hypothetical protein